MVDLSSIVPPPRWPPKLAMVLGIVCFFGSGGSCWIAHGVDRDLQVVEKTMLQMSDAQSQGQSESHNLRDLIKRLKAHKILHTAWQRRQLGLLLAGLVLLLGGFWALGLRNLYDKMTWVEIDDES